jgi:hypothetical protein
LIADLKKGDNFYFFSPSDMKVAHLVANQFDNPEYAIENKIKLEVN